MTMRERRALRSLLVTLLLLLVATAMAFAGPQVQVLEKTFQPAPGRELETVIRGDGAAVRIASPEMVTEARARYRYDESRFEGLLDWDEERNRFRAVVEMHGLGFEHSDETPSDLDLLIPRGVPVRLDLDMKAGAIDIDAEGMRLEGLSVRLWAGELRVDIPARLEGSMKRVSADVKMGELDLRGFGNIAFEELEVNGFTGQIRVDLTGEIRMQRRVVVDLEIGAIEVIVPLGMSVEARISKLGILSEVNVPREWGRNGRYYYSPGAADGDPQLVLEIRGGIGEITIRER